LLTTLSYPESKLIKQAAWQSWLMCWFQTQRSAVGISAQLMGFFTLVASNLSYKLIICNSELSL
jgi:hypothetical protein